MVTRAQSSDNKKLVDVSPELIEQWLNAGDAVLIDVREDFEHVEERIESAQHLPLGQLDPDVIRQRFPDTRVVFHCRSGGRSAKAAEKFRAGDKTVYHLAGGIEAWKHAGKPTIKPAKAPVLPVMRQVQLTAGFLVALGVALGVTVTPWFLAISAFVGCGLMFAGATGWCGMAMILAKMPWNRTSSPAGASCCSV